MELPARTATVRQAHGDPDGRKGRFMACSGYPECKNTFSLTPTARRSRVPGPPDPSSVQQRQRHMWLRVGKRGFFLTCPGYPKCRNLKPVSKEEGELRVEGEALRAAQIAAPGGRALLSGDAGDPGNPPTAPPAA